MLIQQPDMFISNSHLMCFCQPQPTHHLHHSNNNNNHYPNQNLPLHQTAGSHCSSSFHHPVHHHFLPSQQQPAGNHSNLHHLGQPQAMTALNQAPSQPINSSSASIGLSNFGNSGAFGQQSFAAAAAAANLNNAINLNSSNNRSYLNGSPVSQAGDSTVTLTGSSAANVSSEDSLASLDQNGTVSGRLASSGKSRKRRKKDKRKFKQTLSSSFEQLNTNDVHLQPAAAGALNNSSNCSNNCGNLALPNSNAAAATPVDPIQSINRFHQLNSNLFGQLPADHQYFYLNFNQQNSSAQSQSSYSSSPSASLCSNSNLFKNQNGLNNFSLNGLNGLSGLNGLRMDKHNKKLISIGHFNSSILGHLGQSPTAASQQCNLIKQNLLLEGRHYRGLPAQQPPATGSAYRSGGGSFANSLTSSPATANSPASYELAAAANSNLCTALLTPPHSPAHLIQSTTMDTMFTLNNPNCSSPNFASNGFSPGSVNQTNLFNRTTNYHFSTAFCGRPHLQPHFESKSTTLVSSGSFEFAGTGALFYSNSFEFFSLSLSLSLSRLSLDSLQIL